MKQLALVGLGGALGSIARYLLAGLVQSRAGGFPLGTLSVNLVGSFLISLVMHVTVGRAALSPEARLFLATGVLGGFTTYSAFNLETIRLFQAGTAPLALLYFVATAVGCLTAGAAGLLLARALFGP